MAAVVSRVPDRRRSRKHTACLRVWRSAIAEALQSGRAAFPEKCIWSSSCPKAEPIIHLNFYWIQKPATRLPEALWLTFNPVVPETQMAGRWINQARQISPFDVVSAGNRHMHAVTTGFGYQGRQGLVLCGNAGRAGHSLRRKITLKLLQLQPDLTGGIHCGLFNNAWGTNYIMWFGEDMRFRFLLRA